MNRLLLLLADQSGMKVQFVFGYFFPRFTPLILSLDGYGDSLMSNFTTDANAERVFINSIASYGKPWRLSDPGSHDARGLEELRAIFRINIARQKRSLGPRGITYFDYLDNGSFNALAWSSDSYDFVSLFSGSVFHLYRLFYCFMSDPKVLPSIGDATHETLDKRVLAAISGREPTSYAFQHPVDDTRFQAAQNLALVSLLLILNHEMGHIANCHPHYMQQHFGHGIYEELPISSRPEKQNRLSRAFEWEADEYSGVVTYLVMHQIRSLFVGIEELPTDYVLSAAAFMLFLYIHRQTGGPFNVESPTHPAPQHRWLRMTHEIETHERCKQFKPDHESILRGIQDVAAFWGRNKFVEKSQMQLSPTWEDDLQRSFGNARMTLREHDDELKEIESRRNELGQAWFTSNRLTADTYSEEAFAHLAKGVVTRPRNR